MLVVALAVLARPPFWSGTRLGSLAGFRLSEETYSLGKEYHRPANPPPMDSVTARTIDALGSGARHGVAHVMDWFPELDGYRPDHQIRLKEDVVSIGSHGWLTLLHAPPSGNDDDLDQAA